MITLIMAITGFLRGIHEGMVMIRYPEPMHSREFTEGVRGHVWHNYYHELAILRDLSLLGLGIALILMQWQYTGLLAGLVLMWECSEIGHAFARVKFPVMFDRGIAYERIVFMDFKHWTLRGNVVYMFHAFRIILAVCILFA